MEKRKWLWKRRSSLDNKSPGEGESETSESMSSQSEKFSEEQPGHQLSMESTKGSPVHNPQSPEVTSKALGDDCKKENDSTSKNSLLKKLSEADLEDSLEKNLTVESISDGSLNQGVDPDESAEKEENESVNLLKEKLSAALINVSLKDELVKQHSKVAEEAVEGWEKAENEAGTLKKELETLAENHSVLEARSSQLDQALKECVRQLRLTKDDQERKISDAVAVKNKEFVLLKSKLEKQIVELQAKVEASLVQVDPDIHLKLDFLERENQRLKDEVAFQIEELEIRTIERDLSTKAAETASKQNLESIKMVAKLESECRKLKAASRKLPILDKLQKSTSASAHSFDLFKNENSLSRNLTSSSGKMDLMDDFLEMEKLAAMPENGQNPKSELPQSASKDTQNLLREELKVTHCRALELEKKVREMEMVTSKSQISFENMEVELVETKMKLENLEAELQEANELKMDYESYANDLKLEADAMMSKIEQLQQEIDRQRVLSEKLSDRCQELENDLHMKNEELEVERGASCSVELEKKERALDESRKRCDELENQYKKTVMRFENQETALAGTEKCLEELQLKLNEAEMKLETQIAVYSSEIKEKETALAQNKVHLEELQNQLKETETKVEKLQKELHEENVSKENLVLDLTKTRAEVATMSGQIETLQGQIDHEHGIAAELSAKCEELREEINQKEQELEVRQNGIASVEQKINQEDVANAAEKLAECQKTIASLGNQLKSLATLEDFLIDTASIPKFSGSAPLITNGGNELWKYHSNNVYLPQKRCDDHHFKDPEGLHTFTKYVDGEVLDSPSSSSSSMFNSRSSEKRANGYEKLFPMRKG